MKRVLVPIDFSDVAALVIEHAKIFAKKFDAELKIIHVFAPVPQGTVRGIAMVPLNYEVLREELAVELKDEHRKLLNIKQELIREGVRVKAFLLGGNISDVVLSQVKEYNPDIVIMGSHGHGYVAKALLGSISISVLKHVKCPVLVVPSKFKNT